MKKYNPPKKVTIITRREVGQQIDALLIKYDDNGVVFMDRYIEEKKVFIPYSNIATIIEGWFNE